MQYDLRFYCTNNQGSSLNFSSNIKRNHFRENRSLSIYLILDAKFGDDEKFSDIFEVLKGYWQE